MLYNKKMRDYRSHHYTATIFEQENDIELFRSVILLTINYMRKNISAIAYEDLYIFVIATKKDNMRYEINVYFTTVGQFSEEFASKYFSQRNIEIYLNEHIGWRETCILEDLPFMFVQIKDNEIIRRIRVLKKISI